MALVPSTAIDPPVITEVDMGGAFDPSATTVRATVVQASTVFYDTAATLDKAERLIADAAAYGSQLVVFPEAFVGGYPRGSNFGVSIGSRSAKGREDFRKYHAAAIDVPVGNKEKSNIRRKAATATVKKKSSSIFCSEQVQTNCRSLWYFSTGSQRSIQKFLPNLMVPGSGSTTRVESCFEQRCCSPPQYRRQRL